MISHYDNEHPYRTSMKVGNKLGVHGRPATLIREIASVFNGRITYAKKGGEPVDASSVSSVLMQCALYEDEVEFALYPDEPIEVGGSLDGIRETVGALENALAHDDD